MKECQNSKEGQNPKSARVEKKKISPGWKKSPRPTAPCRGEGRTRNGVEEFQQ